MIQLYIYIYCFSDFFHYRLYKILHIVPCAIQVLVVYIEHCVCVEGFPGGSVVKNLPADGGHVGSIPKSERFPGVGNGIPL